MSDEEQIDDEPVSKPKVQLKIKEEPKKYGLILKQKKPSVHAFTNIFRPPPVKNEAQEGVSVKKEDGGVVVGTAAAAFQNEDSEESDHVSISVRAHILVSDCVI